MLVRETKYVVNSSTSLNPPMLSGATESCCGRKRTLIYTFSSHYMKKHHRNDVVLYIKIFVED